MTCQTQIKQDDGLGANKAAPSFSRKLGEHNNSSTCLNQQHTLLYTHKTFPIYDSKILPVKTPGACTVGEVGDFGKQLGTPDRDLAEPEMHKKRY